MKAKTSKLGNLNGEKGKGGGIKSSTNFKEGDSGIFSGLRSSLKGHKPYSNRNIEILVLFDVTLCLHFAEMSY